MACSWPWHPKVIGLSLEARGLWITGLCYAGTNGGVIPERVLKALTMEGDMRSIRHAITELLHRNLWDTGPITSSNPDPNYLVHDFDEHCAWLSQRKERDRIRQQRRRSVLRQSRDASVTVTPERERGTVNSEQRTTPQPPLGDVRSVFDAWVTATGHKACKLDAKRTRVIRARLADYPLEDLLDAVRGWERDPWEGRRAQNEIAILLRDGGNLEKFRDLWRNPSSASHTSTPDLGEHYTGPTPLARQYW